jgi:hypothetical protein
MQGPQLGRCRVDHPLALLDLHVHLPRSIGPYAEEEPAGHPERLAQLLGALYTMHQVLCMRSGTVVPCMPAACCCTGPSASHFLQHHH